MDRWDRSGRELDRYPYRPQRENPSFSSTLLDAIYRSIDEGGAAGSGGEEELVLCRETMTRKKRSNCTAVKGGGVGGFEDDEDTASLRRACMIEKWMEKKVSEKVVVRRKSTAEFERHSRGVHYRDSMFVKSSSSSSDSSSGFSSSETDSVYGRPKPIRTSVSVPPEKSNKQELKPKHESSFVKTKSKAMKIYGDLKKAKQPISPGGRLASFLNSLFTAGNTKKAKISSSTAGAGGDDDTSSKSAYTSTCSSASSFSRSCLSKTPSSRGKLQSNGMKRSVRFYPVSVIVDGDCQPCGHKSLYKDEPNSEVTVNNIRNSIKEELKFHMMEKNRQVEEAARELLKNYHKKVEYERNACNNNGSVEFENDEEEDDDDDGASCASSDLFELDNLSAVGIERYREELPVYETTHLDTNLAIANGLIS